MFSPDSSSQLSFSDPRRDFALSVVKRLRREGFEALWAGGCVRDQLLGKIPKDYDIATTALPQDVIRIFGPKKTVPVGASFGVVMVLGPNKSAGHIEVATFRSEGDYLDGRRPSQVSFCLPEEDAKRRDFTINGIFYDPIANEWLDYVGGRADLEAGVVRAIGDPVARFREDKLRMIRAVRFAATLHFRLDESTAEAIRHHCQDLNQVSVERIAQELRRILAHPSREQCLRLIEETGLLPEIFPELTNDTGRLSDSRILSELSHLRLEAFESAMAILLRPLVRLSAPESPADSKPGLSRVDAVCDRLRLSNDENACIQWLLASLTTLTGIEKRPLHVLKPLLADARAQLLLDVSLAIAAGENSEAVDVEFCRSYLSRTSAERLSPPTLVTGHDVMSLGIPAGPGIRELLNAIRREQLDELLATREQALVRLGELARTFGETAQH